MSIERSAVRQAAVSDAMLGAPRTWWTAAVRKFEGELCGQPARNDRFVLLEPRVQVPPVLAEFPELLVRVCGRPSMLFCLGGTLCRIASRLPPPAP